MTACRDLAPLLALRAAGPLDPADGPRLAAHLEGCPACRAEAARLARALDLVRVPAAGPEEELLAASLPGRLLAAARRPVRPGPLRWAVPLAAAAGAALAFLVPAALHRARPAAAPAAQVARGVEVARAEAEAPPWEEPDEELWEWSGVLSDAEAAESD